MPFNMTLSAVLLVLFAAAAHAETRWLSKGDNEAGLVDSDKILWVEFEGSEAIAFHDGVEVPVTDDADRKWLLGLITGARDAWIRVDPLDKNAKPTTSLIRKKYWRLADIVLVRTTLSTTKAWGKGQDQMKASLLEIHDEDAPRIRKLTRLR
jgi:hypothetical protein